MTSAGGASSRALRWPNTRENAYISTQLALKGPNTTKAMIMAYLGCIPDQFLPGLGRAAHYRWLESAVFQRSPLLTPKIQRMYLLKSPGLQLHLSVGPRH